MPKFLNFDEVFNSCQEKGFFNPLAEIDTEKINSNLLIAEEDLESSNDSAKNERWNTAYKLLYDSLHILIDTYLCFDKVKSLNHQCLFAYLCMKHPELEFSWEFFEKMRTKRNGINYYGQPATIESFKEIEIQAKLYISTLKREINDKLVLQD